MLSEFNLLTRCASLVRDWSQRVNFPLSFISSAWLASWFYVIRLSIIQLMSVVPVRGFSRKTISLGGGSAVKIRSHRVLLGFHCDRYVGRPAAEPSPVG
ncbi:MAG TPA: hypothetical protein VGR93_08880 [Candidatus Acidoferrales bacterium]|nr:hypothetical protein [Candidatus Acidoferrales bacterium]